MPSTEVSGQVVDENGNPLAGMPVTIGTATAVTDQQGDFTLTGIPADPGPISAGGSVAEARGPADLTAPVAQLLGHALYAGADNVIPTPLIVPSVNWSARGELQPVQRGSAAGHHQPGHAGLRHPAAGQRRRGTAATSGTLSVAQLSGVARRPAHAAGRSSGGLLLY